MGWGVGALLTTVHQCCVKGKAMACSEDSGMSEGGGGLAWGREVVFPIKSHWEGGERGRNWQRMALQGSLVMEDYNC